MTTFLMILLFLVALFMILLILVQRGRGGGLAGAFGGMGGQSAFGTKAGDLFTRITIGVASVWIILCIVTVKYLSTSEQRFDPGLGAGAQPSDRQTISPSGDEPPGLTDTAPAGDSTSGESGTTSDSGAGASDTAGDESDS